MPNITTNHAITYTNIVFGCVRVCKYIRIGLNLQNEERVVERSSLPEFDAYHLHSLKGAK